MEYTQLTNDTKVSDTPRIFNHNFDNVVTDFANVTTEVAAVKPIVNYFTLQRNRTYQVGEIAYHPSLPNYLYLECTTAGTTAEDEPMFTAGG